MYKSGKAKRDKRGRIVKAAEFQSKTLPSTRIQPDRRWFGNTRVIGQKQLDQFRTAMADKVGVLVIQVPNRANPSPAIITSTTAG